VQRDQTRHKFFTLDISRHNQFARVQASDLNTWHSGD